VKARIGAIMANQVQIRRGTSSVLNAVVPALAELAYDQTNKRLRLGDGSTLGAMPLPNGADMLVDAFNTPTVSGSANTIVLTSSAYPIAAYAIGQRFRIKPNATNTGSVTVNIDGQGAKLVRKLVGGVLVALEAGDLVEGFYYDITYGGENFQLTTMVATGLQEVRQGNLVTGLGSVTTASSANLTLPGGQFGFYPAIGVSGDFNFQFTASIANASGSWGGFVPRIYMSRTFSGVQLLTAYQRYIASSPPFDLGDGEVGGFFFAQVDHTGAIHNSYLADVPPWAYNGPTDIRATHICKNTGKKYRNFMERGTLEEIMDGMKPRYVMQEITHDIKNADMGLIPHPFDDKEGLTTVLLDPMDDKIRRLIELQNQGGAAEISKGIESGKFIVDNTCLERCSPKGVAVHKMKYKFNGKF
jgi:hypothetical protein